MFYIINTIRFSSFSDLVSIAFIFHVHTFHISELQDSDSENLQMEIRSENLDEMLEKLRNIFISTTETPYLRCLDDP